MYVYVIESIKDNSYYIGHTKDLVKRLAKHNSGSSISTKARMPWKIIYSEKFNNRSEAMKYEKNLKNEKSRGFIERIVKRGMAQLG